MTVFAASDTWEKNHLTLHGWAGSWALIHSPTFLIVPNHSNIVIVHPRHQRFVLFHVSYSSEEKFFGSRSFYQYKCQVHHVSGMSWIFLKLRQPQHNGMALDSGKNIQEKFERASKPHQSETLAYLERSTSLCSFVFGFPFQCNEKMQTSSESGCIAVVLYRMGWVWIMDISGPLKCQKSSNLLYFFFVLYHYWEQ